MDLVTRLPEDAKLPAVLAEGPKVTVWATVGSSDPVERLRDAYSAWVAAGQGWSMAHGANRNAWVALLHPSVAAAASPAGRARAERLARHMAPRH